MRRLLTVSVLLKCGASLQTIMTVSKNTYIVLFSHIIYYVNKIEIKLITNVATYRTGFSTG